MQTQYRFFDDLARLANGAAGTLAGARNEVETLVKQRLEATLADLDVVPREDFEVVRDMARAAREENEALKKRLDALEAKLAKK
jgi:BMFP domain-containing protein YqiC